MIDPLTFTSLVLGVFLAETAKNIGKENAPKVFEKFNLFFDSEITTLGLNEHSNPDDVTKLLDENPEMVNKVRKKLDAHPELANEMYETVKPQIINQSGISITNSVENSQNVRIDQSNWQNADNINNYYGQSQKAESKKVSLKPVITCSPEYIDGYDYHFRWSLDLLNDGEVTVKEFRMDIKFPNKFINQYTIYYSEKTELRTADYRTFRRLSQENNIYNMFPGDSHTIYSGDFGFSDEMKNNGDLNMLVTITIFVGDELVSKTEKTIQDFIANNL